MKNIILVASSTLIFIACGGSDSGSNTTFSGSMQISETYTLFPGDSVIKNSDPAIITITHKDGEEESNIVLIEGNVTIIRKP